MKVAAKPLEGTVLLAQRAVVPDMGDGKLLGSFKRGGLVEELFDLALISGRVRGTGSGSGWSTSAPSWSGGTGAAASCCVADHTAESFMPRTLPSDGLSFTEL